MSKLDEALFPRQWTEAVKPIKSDDRSVGYELLQTLFFIFQAFHAVWGIPVSLLRMIPVWPDREFSALGYTADLPNLIWKVAGPILMAAGLWVLW